MTSDERDEILAEMLDTRASRRAHGDEPELSDENRDEAESLLNVADLIWEAAHGAPPLESDPVAAMLGLVPDAGCALDGKALARARKKSGLKSGELAGRLVARGWDVSPGQVFRWETQSTADVSPALIKAIAEETGTSMDKLTMSRKPTAQDEQLTTVTRSPRFEALVERWSRLRGVPRELAASTLKSQMLATVHRGDRPDDDQLLQSMEAFVTAMESEHELPREP